MKNLLFFMTFSTSILSSVCLAEDACPRTVGSAELSGWYGGESFAAQLPADGVWPTTVPGHLIAVKLVWRSAGFKPGMESNLHVTMKRFNGGDADAITLRSTGAYHESFGGWAMMTGIDFPSAGCWEITGRYLGQELRFVVETVPSTSR